MPKKKVEAIVFKAIIVTYNDNGEPINDEASQEMKIFRAAHTDIWAWLDSILDKTEGK